MPVRGPSTRPRNSSACGARPEQIAGWLYESQPPGAVRLLGEMLGTLELHCDERVATVRLDLQMFERAGAAATDSEGLIDYPRSIRGVEAVALFRERPEETSRSPCAAAARSMSGQSPAGAAAAAIATPPAA